MRVLLAVCPGVGHCLPLLPLASSVRLAGGEVLLATCGEALDVAAASLPVADVGGRRTTMTSLQRQIREQRPDVVATLDALSLHDPARLAIGFAHVSGLLADATVAVARAWRPDVVVCSQLNAAGLVAAAATGVPVVQHGFGPVRTDGWETRVHEQLASVFARCCADAPPPRLAAVDVAPPSTLAGAPEGWPMRYVPHDGGVAPDWLLHAPRRPRIAVTVGTVVPREAGLGSLQRVVAAAAGLDAEVVVALPEPDVAGLDPLPPNVRAVGWMPLPLLLRSCDGLVHHGGAGSTMAALAAGVPQLVLPDGADRHINADAVRRCGAGLDASAETGQADAALLERLVGDPRLRAAARAVSAEIAAMPSPAHVAERLAAFAAARASAPAPT